MTHENGTTRAPEAPASTPPAGARLRQAGELFWTVLTALALALILRTLLFQPFTIPSSSMEPGLVTGDYVVVSKFAYGWSRASLPLNPPLFKGRVLGRGPRRGDVVVFRLPHDPKQAWIKRVIGLPGDRLEVRGASVLVNGRALPRTPLGAVRDHDDSRRTVLLVREREPGGRSYLTYDSLASTAPEGAATYEVPADSYFVMGDNRDNSRDSRWPAGDGVGFLPAENIIGRAELVLLSWKPGSALLKPWTWLQLEPGRQFRRLR